MRFPVLILIMAFMVLPAACARHHDDETGASPNRGDTTATTAIPLPPWNPADSSKVDSIPPKSDSIPSKADSVPSKADSIPSKSDSIPSKSD
jgi:hypothetical protein